MEYLVKHFIDVIYFFSPNCCLNNKCCIIQTWNLFKLRVKKIPWWWMLSYDGLAIVGICTSICSTNDLISKKCFAANIALKALKNFWWNTKYSKRMKKKKKTFQDASSFRKSSNFPLQRNTFLPARMWWIKGTTLWDS